jgi:hypothetical protein
MYKQGAVLAICHARLTSVGHSVKSSPASGSHPVACEPESG